MKLRMGAEDADSSKTKDQSVANTYGNRFVIPLDFELLWGSLPFFQGAMTDRLSYELTFASHKDVTRSTDANSSYTVSNISLEYEVLHHAELARQVQGIYGNKLPIYYDRVICHNIYPKEKSDTMWTINFNTPARSFKGIVLLIKYQTEHNEKLYNPQIKKVNVTIEGCPNQLYANGILPHHHWTLAKNYFGGGRLNDPITSQMCTDLELFDVDVESYLRSKYGLWIDLRSVNDNILHGSGRKIENGADGITLKI